MVDERDGTNIQPGTFTMGHAGMYDFEDTPPKHMCLGKRNMIISDEGEIEFATPSSWANNPVDGRLCIVE